MPVALGIRAEPAALHWAVVEGTVDAPVLRGCASHQCPKTFTEPAALAWVRKQVLGHVAQFKVNVVGLRTAEPTARGAGKGSAQRRVRIEGVVMEATESEGLSIMCGALVTIGRHLGSERPKDYLAAEELRGLSWKGRKNEEKEAILVAVAALGSLK